MTDQLLDPTTTLRPAPDGPPPVLLRTLARCGVAGGALGLTSLVGIIVGEVAVGESYMGTDWAAVWGAVAFLGALLLVAALVGAALRTAPVLGGAGIAGLVGAALAVAAMAGSTATLLLVPALSERAPDIVVDPPAVVPALFISSGLLLGISVIAMAVSLRRAAVLPAWTTRLLLAAGVVTIVPLPSRYFLVALALGAICAVAPTRNTTAEARIA